MYCLTNPDFMVIKIAKRPTINIEKIYIFLSPARYKMPITIPI